MLPMRAAIVSLIFYAAAIGVAQDTPVVLQPADGQPAASNEQLPAPPDTVEERLERLERRIGDTDRAAAGAEGKAAAAEGQAATEGNAAAEGQAAAEGNAVEGQAAATEGELPPAPADDSWRFRQH